MYPNCTVIGDDIIFTSKHPAPPGEPPFTAEEEIIIDDLSIHRDILSQIYKTLESQPGSSPTSIANIIREICKLSQELSDPSTNSPDVPEYLDLASIVCSLPVLQSDTPGQDVITPETEQKRINSILEVLGKVFVPSDGTSDNWAAKHKHCCATNNNRDQNNIGRQPCFCPPT
jgi:hypothetical protein